MSLCFNLNSIIDNEIDDWFKTQWSGSPNHFIINKTESKFSRKWKCLQLKYTIKFIPIAQDFSSANFQIQELFIKLHDDIMNNLDNKDKVMILFNHSSLQYPVSTPFLSRDDLTPLLMMRLIERVSQSNKNLKVDENLEAIVTIYQNPIGKGRLEEYAFDCKSVRLVRNNDGYCLVRALLISKAHLDKDQKYNELCRINSPELDRRTLKIVKDLNLPNDGCGNKEIEKIERYFGKYQITVYEGDAITKDISYLGRPNNKFLYIWRHNNHYGVITSIKAFLKKKYFCDFCKKGFHKPGDHKYCNKICDLCKRTNCIDTDKTDCPHCFFKCRNTICKRIHLEKFCQVANQCEKCSFLNTKRHVCGFDSKGVKTVRLLLINSNTNVTF